MAPRGPTGRLGERDGPGGRGVGGLRSPKPPCAECPHPGCTGVWGTQGLWPSAPPPRTMTPTRTARAPLSFSHQGSWLRAEPPLRTAPPSQEEIPCPPLPDSTGPFAPPHPAHLPGHNGAGGGGPTCKGLVLSALGTGVWGRGSGPSGPRCAGHLGSSWTVQSCPLGGRGPGPSGQGLPFS